mgnify:FL=1
MKMRVALLSDILTPFLFLRCARPPVMARRDTPQAQSMWLINSPRISCVFCVRFKIRHYRDRLYYDFTVNPINRTCISSIISVFCMTLFKLYEMLPVFFNNSPDIQ